MMSSTLFITTFYPFDLRTGFQKVSNSFLGSLNNTDIAVFCLHPANQEVVLNADCPYQVFFYLNNHKKCGPFGKLLQIGKSIISLQPLQVVSHRHPEMKQKIADYCSNHNIDTIYIEAIWLLPLVPKIKDIEIKLHAHMVDSHNIKSAGKYWEKVLKYPFYFLMRNFEKKYYKKFDEILTNSTTVKGLIQGEFNLDVKLRKNFYNSEIIKDYRAQFGNNVLLVGDFTYRPNMEALENLLHIIDVFPTLTDDFRFKVVGKLPSLASFRRRYPDIEFLGFVSDIYAEMSSCAISICPIDYASGTKIKIIESMRIGLPVVTSRACIDASGCLEGEGIQAYSSAEDFRECLYNIAGDIKFWQEQSNKAVQYACLNFE